MIEKEYTKGKVTIYFSYNRNRSNEFWHKAIKIGSITLRTLRIGKVTLSYSINSFKKK